MTARDAVHARQRPKLERYDDTLFMVMRTVAYPEHELHSVNDIIETGDLMIFTARQFVGAVRHGVVP